MIKSKAKKESDRKDKVIRALTIFALILLGMVIHSHYLLANLPKEFECNFPPDTSQGGKVMVNETPRHQVYGLAFGLFQKIYRCEKDCSVEFANNIRAYGYFYTDTYRQKMLSYAASREGYNRKRIRSISEHGNYKQSKVIPLGNGVWVVYLDVVEKEYIGSKKVRDAIMRYPVVMVKNDVDRENNPWRLAFDDPDEYENVDGKPRRLK